jgi:hypothetical protein
MGPKPLFGQVLGCTIRQQPGGAAATNDDVLDDHAFVWIVWIVWIVLALAPALCVSMRRDVFICILTTRIVRFVELLKNLKCYQMS